MRDHRGAWQAQMVFAFKKRKEASLNSLTPIGFIAIRSSFMLIAGGIKKPANSPQSKNAIVCRDEVRLAVPPWLRFALPKANKTPLHFAR